MRRLVLAFPLLLAACSSPSTTSSTSTASSISPPGGRDFSAYPAVVDLPAPSAIYAVSDVHGGYGRLVALLAANQIIAASPASPDAARWAAGDAVLVVVGDLIDKGPEGLEVIDALRALTVDAEAKGGHVVVLLGNHEAEFFVDPHNPKAEGSDGIDVELHADGIDPAALASGADARGAWLAQRPLGARVGAWFFAHAGNTKGRSLSELSQALEGALVTEGFAGAEISGADSIVEARDWYADDDTLGARYAAALGVEHIVFGHDPHALGVDGKIALGQGGTLLRVDCGMSPDVDYGRGELLQVVQEAGKDVARALDAQAKHRALWSAP
jgi:hypothetical protein